LEIFDIKIYFINPIECDAWSIGNPPTPSPISTPYFVVFDEGGAQWRMKEWHLKLN